VLLLTGCNTQQGPSTIARNESTTVSVSSESNPSSPQLTYEQIKSLEAERQARLADRWNDDRNVPAEQRTLVAIECLCDEVNASSAYTTDRGAEVTRQARDFLLHRGAAAVPALIKVCRLSSRPAEVANRVRLDQVIDLLARIGDRRAVAPLVDVLLSAEVAATRHSQSLAHGIARLGDPDTASQLIEAYPWMPEATQDVIVQILGLIDSQEQLPIMLSWANKARRDSFHMTYALTGFRDERCEPVFRKALTNPRASGSHYSAVRGLALLGIRDIDLKSISQNGKQHVAGYLEQAQDLKQPPVRYALRFDTSNQELRELVGSRIRVLRQQMAAGRSEQGLRLKLVPPSHIKIGEEPKFKLVLTNVSRKVKVVLKGRDASDFGWVSPSLGMKVRGPDHRPCQSPASGRCGNVNTLRKEDYVALKPGQSLDVLDGGHWKLRGGVFTRPGVYSIQASYDTKIEGRKDVQRPVGVVQVRLVAPVVLVEATWK